MPLRLKRRADPASSVQSNGRAEDSPDKTREDSQAGAEPPEQESTQRGTEPAKPFGHAGS
jgi:hypothetical protein